MCVLYSMTEMVCWMLPRLLWLKIQYVTKFYFPLLLPLASTILFSAAICLTILDSSCKWNQTVFISHKQKKNEKL